MPENMPLELVESLQAAGLEELLANYARLEKWAAVCMGADVAAWNGLEV